MSPHFHFHNDRNLSSNTTNSSLPNQVRLTICCLLAGSCLLLVSQSLSFKPWLVKGVWPEVEKRSNFYISTLSLSRWPDIVLQYIKRIEKDWQLLCDRSNLTNQSNGINLVLVLIFILVQKSSFKATLLQNSFSQCLPSEAGRHILNGKLFVEELRSGWTEIEGWTHDTSIKNLLCWNVHGKPITQYLHIFDV